MDVGSRRSSIVFLVAGLAAVACRSGDRMLANASDPETAPLPSAISEGSREFAWESAAPVQDSGVAVVSYRTRAPAGPVQQPTLEPEKVAEQTRVAGVDAETDDGEASADQTEEEEGTPAWLDERWHRFGPVAAEYLYTGEGFCNTRGGMRTQGATRYRGNFDLTLRLNTEAANWWTGGEVFVYMQHSHGRTLTPEFVGDGQYYSNIDTSTKPQDLTQLGEYWYQQRFHDDQLSVRVGRQDPNAEFAFADLGGDFINSSFVTLANIPLPAWPFQTLGVSALYQPLDKLRLGGGVYDQGCDQQQWWVTTTTRGMFCIAQADFQPLADHEDALLTIVRGGAWYTSSDTQAVDASSVFEGNYGFYVTVDRLLFPEPDDAEQGLGAFGQFSWAPPDRNMVDRHFGTGLVYRGLLPGRDSDTVGVGFTQIAFSADVRNITGQTAEDAVELFCKFRLREWLAVQPDLQYIVRPSGVERDALVVGVRFEAAF